MGKQKKTMNIQRQLGAVSASLTLCFATPVLSSSATAHCAEPNAEEAISPPKHQSVTPAPRIADWWFARQAEKIGRMSKGEYDLLMVGDSITHNF